MVPDAVLQLNDDFKSDTIDDISALTGRSLRRLITRRGFFLDRLGKISGASCAMLGQIETGKSSRTISILSKIASALDVPCGSLIAERKELAITPITHVKSKDLSSSEGKFRTRALFPFDSDRKVEFYQVRIAAHHAEIADAHQHGTVENDEGSGISASASAISVSCRRSCWPSSLSWSSSSRSGSRRLGCARRSHSQIPDYLLSRTSCRRLS
ncbi:helix-turn-helix domain-containing protein [Agrobacterium rosae]|uniref:Anaerobic benzoate catabolism transcriptional regulator n=1 Tax=Agrobacterium rosae TaxID=1972867 RepID=A0A1R3U2E8_9HYPH|nr:helix-turn-helix transcriptional regulator [Agrobacterium rosae]SCX35352.1 anaerobic benzoate catabolism transcriptional regulator [Agrobacterium rosae]